MKTKKKAVKKAQVVKKKALKKTEKKNQVLKVIKRSGKVVSFDQRKITVAVAKAFAATGEGDFKDAQKVSEKVVQLLNKNHRKGYLPEIEEIQDLVEKGLMATKRKDVAKAYMLYREERTKKRGN